MKKLILIIEDESGIADIITYSLSTEGFETEWVTTGTDGLKVLENKPVDLIILDVGLPDINGFELIKKVRTRFDIPVLFLTARSDEIDRILGLELGGDDYVVKPFSPRELSARVKAILRRARDNKKHPGNSSGEMFVIDSNKRQILYFSKKLQLTRYEYEILVLLIKRPGWVYSREKIMEMIWVEPEESFDRTVDAHIKTIRGKLKEIKPDHDPIVTHRGVGYALKDET